MKRRSFLKQAGLASAALLIPHKNMSIIAPKPQKVLILGAGISGLGAAYQLQKQGIAFEVLEARNRAGGRILTAPIQEGLTVELGAEWIGSGHKTLLALCQELGLELLEHRFETGLLLNGQYQAAGQWHYEATWQQKLQKIQENFLKSSPAQQLRLDKIDWWRFLRKQGINAQDLEIRELLDSTDFGESIRQVSAYAALSEYAESSPYNEMDFRVKGGNSEIIKALLQKIGTEKVHLQKEVQRIAQDRKGIRVSCKDGSEWQADKVICTLPVAALLHIDFAPQLPAIQQEAIEALQYARIMKTSVLFKERFWKEANFSAISDSTAHFLFHSTQNQAGTKGVLTAYSTGDKAYVMSKKSKQAQIQAVCEALQVPFGDMSPLAEKVVSYYWGADPFTDGAYALYGRNQWSGLQEALQKPFRHLHFAGEHLAEWQGFMEGALQTGIDAAKQWR
jgi:monoamine oxidase